MSPHRLEMGKYHDLKQNYRSFLSQNWAEIDISKGMTGWYRQSFLLAFRLLSQPCSDHGGQDAER